MTGTSLVMFLTSGYTGEWSAQVSYLELPALRTLANILP